MFKLSQLFKHAHEKTGIGNSFRNKRFHFFLEKIAHLPKPVKILDVGGVPSYWENRDMLNNEDIHVTMLNLEAPSELNGHFKGIQGDATDMSFIADKQYDVVFSNSVIEHLYTKEKQLQMANEVRRVGTYYFIQTPNKYFPIEPHYVLPLMQFMPRSLQYNILTKTKLSLLKKWDAGAARQCVDEIRLLNLREMRQLFPDGKVYLEKFAGLTKSITLYNL